MADDQFANLVERAITSVPPSWSPIVGKPLLCEKHREAWHRLLLTWQDAPAKGDLARGDIVLDSRCGVVTYGVVIAVNGCRVYYIDGCASCRDGRHHRCIAGSRTTHKGRGRIRATSLRRTGSEW